MHFILPLLLLTVLYSCQEETIVEQAGVSTLSALSISSSEDVEVNNPGEEYEVKGRCNPSHKHFKISFDGGVTFEKVQGNPKLNSSSDLNCTDENFNIKILSLTESLGFNQANIGEKKTIIVEAIGAASKRDTTRVRISSTDAFPPSPPQKFIAISDPDNPVIEIIDDPSTTDLYGYECQIDSGEWFSCSHNDRVTNNGVELEGLFYGDIRIRAIDTSGNRSSVLTAKIKKGYLPNAFDGEILDMKDINEDEMIIVGNFNGYEGDKGNITVIDNNLNKTFKRDLIIDNTSHILLSKYLSESFYTISEGKLIVANSQGEVRNIATVEGFSKFLVEDKINGDIYFILYGSSFSPAKFNNNEYTKQTLLKVSNNGIIDESLDQSLLCSNLSYLRSFDQQNIGEDFLFSCYESVKKIIRDPTGIASNYTITPELLNLTASFGLENNDSHLLKYTRNDSIYFFSSSITNIFGTPSSSNFVTLNSDFTYKEDNSCASSLTSNFLETNDYFILVSSSKIELLNKDCTPYQINNTDIRNEEVVGYFNTGDRVSENYKYVTSANEVDSILTNNILTNDLKNFYLPLGANKVILLERNSKHRKKASIIKIDKNTGHVIDSTLINSNIPIDRRVKFKKISKYNSDTYLAVEYNSSYSLSNSRSCYYASERRKSTRPFNYERSHNFTVFNSKLEKKFQKDYESRSYSGIVDATFVKKDEILLIDRTLTLSTFNINTQENNIADYSNLNTSSACSLEYLSVNTIFIGTREDKDYLYQVDSDLKSTSSYSKVPGSSHFQTSRAIDFGGNIIINGNFMISENTTFPLANLHYSGAHGLLINKDNFDIKSTPFFMTHLSKMFDLRYYKEIGSLVYIFTDDSIYIMSKTTGDIIKSSRIKNIRNVTETKDGDFIISGNGLTKINQNLEIDQTFYRNQSVGR